jgi:hypothetical protein
VERTRTIKDEEIEINESIDESIKDDYSEDKHSE